MTTTQERAAYSPAETARLLGVSEATVYNMVANKTVKSVRIGKKRILVPANEIERLLATSNY